MFTIIKHQIKEGLKDARFIFLALLILLAFLINGLIFSVQYHADVQSWHSAVNENTQLWRPTASNLQSLSNYEQSMAKPPSPVAFIAGGQEDKIPNTVTVNAFRYLNPEVVTRDNKIMPVVYALDWVFIIGSLLTLLAVFLSYDSICGEKRDGTLGLVMSNSISRLEIFFGKFLGLLFVLALTMLVGVLLNLAVLVMSGSWPVSTHSGLRAGILSAAALIDAPFGYDGQQPH
jgi:ABC-type transport system involved in multi-copper enzyme maturation permease subunit